MKAVLTTGANVGIGFATAKFLAADPEYHVLLACRQPHLGLLRSQIQEGES